MTAASSKNEEWNRPTGRLGAAFAAQDIHGNSPAKPSHFQMTKHNPFKRAEPVPPGQFLPGVGAVFSLSRLNASVGTKLEFAVGNSPRPEFRSLSSRRIACGGF
jgi:hypothetical protein